MSTSALAETLATWREITTASEPFLDALTTAKLMRDLPMPSGKKSGQRQGDAIEAQAPYRPER